MVPAASIVGTGHSVRHSGHESMCRTRNLACDEQLVAAACSQGAPGQAGWRCRAPCSPGHRRGPVLLNQEQAPVLTLAGAELCPTGLDIVFHPHVNSVTWEALAMETLRSVVLTGPATNQGGQDSHSGPPWVLTLSPGEPVHTASVLTAPSSPSSLPLSLPSLFPPSSPPFPLSLSFLEINAS